MCTIMANETFNINYYQSDFLWKLWLVESIQPIYNRMWSWHDNSISAAVIIMGVLFKRLFKICIIKKLLNSVFVWYHKLSASALADNSDLGIDNSLYHAQPHQLNA